MSHILAAFEAVLDSSAHALPPLYNTVDFVVDTSSLSLCAQVFERVLREYRLDPLIISTDAVDTELFQFADFHIGKYADSSYICYFMYIACKNYPSVFVAECAIRFTAISSSAEWTVIADCPTAVNFPDDAPRLGHAAQGDYA